MTTILLIEDDILLADCYIRWLTAEDLRVHHVTTAQDALDALDVVIPQAIILDMLLPAANGMQVLHTLRSYSDTSRIPVIVCSNATFGDEAALLAYGVRKVLDKTTLTRSKLHQAVRGAVA